MPQWIDDVREEMDAKWGKIRMRAFVEAGVDMSVYYNEFSGLYLEAMLWANLDEMHDLVSVEALRYEKD